MPSSSSIPRSDSPHWYIRLLGTLRLQSTTEEIVPAFRSRRGALLLAYLSLNPGVEHSREKLCHLLWEDEQESLPLQQRRRSLSADLPVLRRLLEPSGTEWARGGARTGFLLITDKESVCLNASGIRTDVAELNEGLRTENRSEVGWRRLQRAVDMYRTSGKLLPGFYDRWVEEERERLHVLYVRALRIVVARLEAANEPLAALSYALTAQAEEPEEEIAATVLRLESTVSTSSQARREREALTPFLAMPTALEARKATGKRKPRRGTGDPVLDAIQTTLARLPLPTRQLFPRLSVFEGGFSTDTVASVCRVPHAKTLLGTLRNVHLLVREGSAEPYRYQMLETVRRVALAQLPCAEHKRLTARHVSCVLTVSRRLMMASRSGKLPAAQYYAHLSTLLGEDGTLLERLIINQWDVPEPKPAAIRRGVGLVHYGWHHLHKTLGVQKCRDWQQRALSYGQHLPSTEHRRLIFAFLRSHNTSFPGSTGIKDALRMLDEITVMKNLTLTQRAVFLLEMAQIAHRSEQDSLTMALLEEAMPHLTTRDRINALLVWGESLSIQGYLPAGRDRHEEALKIAQELNEDEAIALANTHLASTLLYLGDVRAARPLFEAALNYHAHHVFPSEVNVLEQLLRYMGMLHIAAGEWGRATQSFRESFHLCTEANLPEPASVCRRGLGIVAFCLGNLELAKTHFQEGVVIWEEKKHHRWQALFLLHLAEVTYHSHDDAAALRHIQEAEGHLTQTNAPTSVAWALWLRGRLMVRAKDISAALALHCQALQLRLRYAGKKAHIESLESIAVARAKSGDRRDIEEVAVLLRAAHAARAALGLPRPLIEQPEIEGVEALIGRHRDRDAIPDETPNLPLEHAVRRVLEGIGK